MSKMAMIVLGGIVAVITITLVVLKFFKADNSSSVDFYDYPLGV